MVVSTRPAGRYRGWYGSMLVISSSRLAPDRAVRGASMSEVTVAWIPACRLAAWDATPRSVTSLRYMTSGPVVWVAMLASASALEPSRFPVCGAGGGAGATPDAAT